MITCVPEDVKVVRVEGGYFSFLEYEEDIFNMMIRDEDQGSANRILRKNDRTGNR